MKKEKTVRSYKRKTKSGKVVTVKQHTAKYDAAEAFKEALAKKGAGSELATKQLTEKELKQVQDIVEENSELDEEYLAAFYPELSPKMVKAVMAAHKAKSATPKAKAANTAGKSPKSETPDLGFTADEYKAWYHWDMDKDPKNPSALKVKKALVAAMGPRAYRKYEDDMTDSYSARGDKKAFGAVGELVQARKDAYNAKLQEKTAKAQASIAKAYGATDAAEKHSARAKEQGEKRKDAQQRIKGVATKDDTGGLKIGSTVKMSEAIDGSRGKAQPVKVLAVQKASKSDFEFGGTTHVAWVQRKDGSITLAGKEEDGKWYTDNTWSDLGSKIKTHPYAKSLSGTGFKMHKKSIGDYGDFVWEVVPDSPKKGAKSNHKTGETSVGSLPDVSTGTGSRVMVGKRAYYLRHKDGEIVVENAEGKVMRSIHVRRQAIEAYKREHPSSPKGVVKRQGSSDPYDQQRPHGITGAMKPHGGRPTPTIGRVISKDSSKYTIKKNGSRYTDQYGNIYEKVKDGYKFTGRWVEKK